VIRDDNINKEIAIISPQYISFNKGTNHFLGNFNNAKKVFEESGNCGFYIEVLLRERPELIKYELANNLESHFRIK
jgi:hypothetical protein